MISYNPWWCNSHTTCTPTQAVSPRSAASCKKWSQTTELSSGPPSRHGFCPVTERVLLSVHRDMAGVTQCMATICVSTCLRTSFWFGFYLVMSICSVFTSTSSPEHLQDTVAHMQGSAQVTEVCVCTVPWFSVTHTWTSGRGLGVGLISFCLLKCVQMDVLVMVALETSRTYRAWPGQSLSCCQEQGRSKAGTNVLAGNERFFCPAHSRNSSMEWQLQEPSIHQPLPRARRCSSKLLPARVWPSQEEPQLSPGRGEVGFHWANILLY